jgi:hypothetical protein
MAANGEGGKRQRGQREEKPYDIPGFQEALLDAMNSAGVTAEETDMDATILKITNACGKQSHKFFNDPRCQKRMPPAECRAFIGEFVETVMSVVSSALYDKSWIEKLSWNGPLLMLSFSTFEGGKCFNRTLKTEIIQYVDDGLLTWSEEERMQKAMWNALDAAGIGETQKKKAGAHLQKAYDDAHWSSPFGESQSDSLGGPELATLQDFVKGWMTIFLGKAWSALENSCEGTGAQVQALTVIFQKLLDPEAPCLPFHLQTTVPAGEWPFIADCAASCMAEAEGGGKKRKHEA